MNREGPDKNMEMLSNGSHRDDVSQSTMAARSSKILHDVKGEMSATMTTIDGSERALPKLVSRWVFRYYRLLNPKRQKSPLRS